MNIGKELREVYVEPITTPVPEPERLDPAPPPVPVGAPDDEDIHVPA